MAAIASAEKAKRLARYALRHGTGLGHIDLIARVDGHLRRLHLDDEETRKLVNQIDGLAGLLNLYKRRRTSAGAARDSGYSRTGNWKARTVKVTRFSSSSGWLKTALCPIADSKGMSPTYAA